MAIKRGTCLPAGACRGRCNLSGPCYGQSFVRRGDPVALGRPITRNGRPVGMLARTGWCGKVGGAAVWWMMRRTSSFMAHAAKPHA